MSERSTKRRGGSSTRELIDRILQKLEWQGQRLERQDQRLEAIEAQQTLALSAIQRQGRVTEEVNRRCMEKLGICPIEDAEEDDGEPGTSS